MLSRLETVFSPATKHCYLGLGLHPLLLHHYLTPTLSHVLYQATTSEGGQGWAGWAGFSEPHGVEVVEARAGRTGLFGGQTGVGRQHHGSGDRQAFWRAGISNWVEHKQWLETGPLKQEGGWKTGLGQTVLLSRLETQRNSDRAGSS